MEAPTLMTARLELRAVSMSDWEPYAAMWSDPRVTAFIGGSPRPRDVAWTKFCQSAGLWPLLGYGFWSVIDRADKAYLGTAGFALFERANPALDGFPEAGWAFAAESWGRGIASEVVGAIVGWADTNIPVSETRCMIDHDNLASAAVARRNGYAPCTDQDRAIPIFRRPVPGSAA